MFKNIFLISIAFCLLINTAISQQCFNKNNLNWRSGNNKLSLNDQQITIQGIAWFGMETGTFSPGGLKTTSVEALLDLLVQLKFNALRLPFSVDMILNNRYPNEINYSLNPNLRGKTALQVLQYITEKSGERGILVVLEQHRFDPSDYISALWYSTQCITNVDGACVNYTPELVVQSWITLTKLFQQYWNLWALDIKNEPHDPATWGAGNPATDFDKAFTSISNQIGSATNFNGVYFIEGVQNNNAICSNNYNNWWGGNMSPVQCFPVYLNQADRLVYAPHTYCSSVFDQEYFNTADYPENMPTVWDSQFGFLYNNYYALVLGEWGCKLNNTKNQKWMDRFVTYLNDKNIKSHLFFSLNPDSADTDSPLYADWKSINQNTVNVLNRINSSPTKFTPNGNQICLGAVSTTTAPATTGVASTTGKPSTTGSATTGSATTGSATTGSATTGSATTGSATTGSVTTTGSTSGSSNIIINQVVRQTWFDGTSNYMVVDGTIKNGGSTNTNSPKLRSDKIPQQIWGLDSGAGNTWTLSWNPTLTPGQSIEFGYIVASSSPIQFTIIA
ncbi:hypothetical protein DICPUDRAFT_148310 [Dictyostelium purpureum]|uniref:Endoglucanase n=1 Tax=Dictyostelium purpureum TaxID=5786 RepID=F0ZAS7_DICPU|nr:uncharacterized protein DICPUDRAFT_148310 [Dictyostelium purpureum]EGC38974.1 hypothetical protein DICPUDRAFT_148310 [Dictyostelium purpureum]|eukprot:XP_003284539.1 hypothetical protein DICPUDRAFT_148310 [Dictyostelium purpureum]